MLTKLTFRVRTFEGDNWVVYYRERQMPVCVRLSPFLWSELVSALEDLCSSGIFQRQVVTDGDGGVVYDRIFPDV